MVHNITKLLKQGKIMGRVIDSNNGLVETGLSKDLNLTVLTYNTHLFGGSNADYANQARIKIAEKFPWIVEKYPNIFKDIPNIIYEDDDRAQHILYEIKDSGANIVALQEVWACNRQKWFAEQLKDIYPYSYFYREHCKNPDAKITEILEKFLEILETYNRGDSSDPDPYQKVLEHFKNNSGLLLLSKYPLETRETEFHEFPPGRTKKKLEDGLARKGVITATVKLPDGSVFRVGITHANTDTVDQNMQDIRDLVELTIKTDPVIPAIMMGDFNIRYNNYEKMANIFKEACGAIDAYGEATGKASNDPTVDHEANKLYPKFTKYPDSKKDCIDYVFFQPDSSRLKLKAKSAMVIKDWNYGNDRMDLSDHYPVLVTFYVIGE
jgi:endonuclease/exonuclease/phosphatase family metal-dependent hydrolase